MAPAARPVLPKINTHVPIKPSSNRSKQETTKSDKPKDSDNGSQPNGSAGNADGRDGLLKAPSNYRGTSKGQDDEGVAGTRPDLPIPRTPTVVPPTPLSAESRGIGHPPRVDSPVAEEEEERPEPNDLESPEQLEAESPAEMDNDGTMGSETGANKDDGNKSPPIVSTPEEQEPFEISESPSGENQADSPGFVTFESPVEEYDFADHPSVKGKDHARPSRDAGGDDDSDDDEADKDIAELASRKLQIGDQQDEPKPEKQGGAADPRARWAQVRQRAKGRMDSAESNTTMGAERPSRNNTIMLSSMEQDEELHSDGQSEVEVGSPDEMSSSKIPLSRTISSGRPGQAARGRLDRHDTSATASTRSRSTSSEPKPIASTFLAKSPANMQETASLPIPNMPTKTGDQSLTSSSESAKSPYWNVLATSPMAGVLSSASEEEAAPPVRRDDLQRAQGSRRKSGESSQPRPDFLHADSAQSSVSSSRSAPNSPRIQPVKDGKTKAFPKPPAKAATRANTNPVESDADEHDLGAELRSRLSGHPGHVRRNSSTHRVLETLDAKHHSNEKGQRMVNQYALGPLIGRGAYGNVEKGIDVGTGAEYAIKEFSKLRLKRQQQQQISSAGRIRKAKFEMDPASQGGNQASSKGKGKSDEDDPLALIRREIAVMKKLDHPNLVLLYEAINVATSDSLYLVLEYVPGGTVIDVKVGGKPTKALDVETSRSYFRQLTLGLEYLHSAGVTHRDIKPDNVLLSADRKRVKFCDFGVSEMFSSGDDRLKKAGGSPAFMSPEVAIVTQAGIHAKPVDIWAMGVTLYCMLRGCLPFEADNPLELFEAIKEQEPVIPEDWDEDIKDLVQRMLKKNPDERMVMADLREHPWLTKNGEDPMPTTEKNLYEIGKQVEEPSEEEVGNAISTMRASFTVILAIQKMRRMYRRRRGLSSSGSSNSAWSTPTMLSPTTEHPSRPGGGGGGGTSRQPSQQGTPSQLVGPRGNSITPNGEKDGHVTSPEEIEGGEDGMGDYFGSHGDRKSGSGGKGDSG